MIRSIRTRPVVAITALVLTAALSLGGCGGDDGGGDDGGADSSSDSSDTATATGGADGAPQVSQEFRDCMEEQGAELPTEAPSDGAGTVDPELQQAFQQCSDLAPDNLPGGGGESGGIDQSALDAFADCMGERGVEVEPTLEAVGELDRKDADVTKALDTCADLIRP